MSRAGSRRCPGCRVGLPEEAGSSVMEGQIPTPSLLRLGGGVGSGISCQLYPDRSFPPKVAHFACSLLSLLFFLNCISCLTPPTQLLCYPPAPSHCLGGSILGGPAGSSCCSHTITVHSGGGRGGLRAACPWYPMLPSAPHPWISQGSAMQPG